jgi:hypothetical protein
LEERKVSDRRFKEIADAENGRKLRELQGWLRAPNVANDQHEFSRLRSEYPGTGRWLLDNQKFKDWFAPLCQSIPPVLWLNGIPGAGELVTGYTKPTDDFADDLFQGKQYWLLWLSKKPGHCYPLQLCCTSFARMATTSVTTSYRSLAASYLNFCPPIRIYYSPTITPNMRAAMRQFSSPRVLLKTYSPCHFKTHRASTSFWTGLTSVREGSARVSHHGFANSLKACRIPIQHKFDVFS